MFNFTIENNNINDIVPPLPFVNEIIHLGNIFQTDPSINVDMTIKRAKFIFKIHSLNQEF